MKALIVGASLMLLLLPTSVFALDLPNLIRGVFIEQPERFVAIATCESGVAQYRNGVVVENPKTKDYGVFQIHYTWIATAQSMGLDIKGNVYDNIIFAKWLYDKYGTEPWSSSVSCQEKHLANS